MVVWKGGEDDFVTFAATSVRLRNAAARLLSQLSLRNSGRRTAKLCVDGAAPRSLALRGQQQLAGRTTAGANGQLATTKQQCK
uniref:Uncharacterized protein n=1 Tax=Trichuris muris TaxID=70415 RepID=A0A5S6R4D2_TRIMR